MFRQDFESQGAGSSVQVWKEVVERIKSGGWRFLAIPRSLQGDESFVQVCKMVVGRIVLKRLLRESSQEVEYPSGFKESSRSRIFRAGV